MQQSGTTESAALSDARVAGFCWERCRRLMSDAFWHWQVPAHDFVLSLFFLIIHCLQISSTGTLGSSVVVGFSSPADTFVWFLVHLCCLDV